jgi:serine/threonine-protein kinase RsbW
MTEHHGSANPIFDAVAMERLTCAAVPPILCWRRTFPGLPDQPKEARDFAGFLADDHVRASDVRLVTSELATNTLRHTRSGLPGGLFIVDVRRSRRGLAIAVVDQGGPSQPTLRPTGHSLDALTESGRGLFTVEAYATWWAWRGDERSRTVTAFFWD